MHGSAGRESATGRGTMFGIMNMLKAFNEGEIRGKTFAIQGFGNVGACASSDILYMVTCAVRVMTSYIRPHLCLHGRTSSCAQPANV